MKNSIYILEFPLNLGLKEPFPGHEPGVRRLPDYLKKYNFHSLLNAEKVLRLNAPVYSMQLDESSGVRNAEQIIEYARQQARMLSDVISLDKFPIVIGGDCSILIGNGLAMKKMGNYGLFFLDGHTDYMWPSLSQTGGAAGMDLAIVTGYGHDKLTDIDGMKPYFEEERVWCVGNRDYEEWYVEAIKDSRIRYIDIDHLREDGISKCVNDFLNMVRVKNLDGFWIHIDVDVLNNDIMPAVDSPQPGGLDYLEFNEILGLLLDDSRATGLEITILDPDLDPTGEYTNEFVRNFCKLYNQ